MALYFILGTLTQEGQRMLYDNPDRTADAIRSCNFEDARVLGQYAVIGRQDFVIMAEADDVEAIARLSLDIGVRVGMHTETLPAIAIGLMVEPEPHDREGDAEYADNPPSGRDLPSHETLPSLIDIYGPRGN